MLGANMVRKACGRCQIEKSIDEFPYKNMSKGERHSICKECTAQRSKDIYYTNREARINQVAEKRRSYRDDAREFVLSYLSTHPCVDCGESDPVVLDFDHIRGQKTRNVSQMIDGGVSLSTIQREIEKCEVRCANCHRIKTAERRISLFQVN